MIVNVILPALILSAIYAVIVLGLTLLLRRLRVPRRVAIVASFSVFGLTTGLLAAWLWPVDSSVYLNWPGVLLGQLVYNLSIQTLGDSHSSQAHYTIPWLLRIPQAMVLTSLVVWTVLGLLVQLHANRKEGPTQ